MLTLAAVVGSRRHPKIAVTDGRGGPTCCSRILAILHTAILLARTALVAAACRHHLVKAAFAPLLPAYWLMHWTASWRAVPARPRPFLWEKTPHTAVAAA